MPSPDDRKRFKIPPETSVDVVVIGSGMGGLTAAALLAARGLAVLVVEQHSVPGGNVSAFRRRGYRFDVGLHYIGECQPGGAIARILEATGIDDLELNELDPDGFDTLVFPGLAFRVPRGIDPYRERLVALFPREVAAIDRYVGLLARFSRFVAAPPWDGVGHGLVPEVTRFAAVTLEQVLDEHTQNRALRAVLCGQQGLYGLPPDRVSFATHALAIASFLNGGYYPRGGGQALSDRLVATVEQRGGQVVLGATAEWILVEKGRVTGVELSSRHLGRHRVRARAVISNADIKKTLLELVDAGQLDRRFRRRAEKWEMAPAAACLYLGARRDLRAEGTPNTNFWIHQSLDEDGAGPELRAGRLPSKANVLVSCTSLRDPSSLDLAPPGISNLQLMTGAPAAPAAWGTTDEAFRTGAYRRDPGYARAKKLLAERMVRCAEAVLPGLGGQLVFQELATPLTHCRYTGATGGTGYGIAGTPAQSGARRPGPTTSIRGLLLCGASNRWAHGVLGAMLSGVDAAAHVDKSMANVSPRSRA